MNSQSDAAGCFTFQSIGVVQSCFKEKFGIPRQPGLAPSARGRIYIFPEFAQEEAFAGLEACSHIWLQFVFHAARETWKPKVRPPRLGGNKTLGVFASRSPNRPNPLGLSVVAFCGMERDARGLFLEVAGIDLLDGTPILDIKPYVPYADAVTGAFNHVAAAAPILHPVIFTEEAQRFCSEYSPTLQTLIIEVLQQDPRPQYHSGTDSRTYGMKILNLNLRWQYCEPGNYFAVDQLSALPNGCCCIKVLDIQPLYDEMSSETDR